MRGAFDGILESSCFFFEETLGWRGINIEASPPIFKKLQQRRPKAINIHAALSDDVGIVDFTHVYHPKHGENFGNGSVSHTKAHKEELDREKCTYKSFSVPKRTYRSIIDEHAIQSLDLMVLDVEGHEQAVIRGMVGSAVLPRIFCVEFGHVGLDKLRSVLGEIGYDFEAVSHANAFFVRRAT